jgi:hypothetical protein
LKRASSDPRGENSPHCQSSNSVPGCAGAHTARFNWNKLQVGTMTELDISARSHKKESNHVGIQHWIERSLSRSRNSPRP